MAIRHAILPFILLLSMSQSGLANVFKCLDASGKVIYSGKMEVGLTCTPVTAPVNQVPSLPPRQTDTGTQSIPDAAAPVSEQDEIKKRIAAEEAALAQARKELAQQESIRLGEERNYQRVLDRLKPYQDKVAEIEKRIESLRTQVKNLK